MITGGTGVMLVVSGTTAPLNGVVPPLVETSTPAVAVTGPAELSISRTVRAPGVPEKLLFGTNTSCAVAGRTIAVLSPSPLGMLVQVEPPSSE